MDELNNIIRSAREAKRLKGKEMAEILGISAAQFCRIERGNSRPSLKVLKEICKTLDLNFRELSKMAGYSEKAINKAMNCSFDKEEVLIITWYLSRLSNQDFELARDLIRQLPNLTNKEKNTIKFIISYKDDASV